MKKLKNLPITKRICLLVAIVAFSCISLLFAQVIRNTNVAVESAKINHLLDTVEARTNIINNYIYEIEDCIKGFAVSDEVVNILKDSDNKEYQEKIQNYIKNYADVKGSFEGLYVANTDTVVVAHTISKDIGVQYRSGDDRKEFLSQVLVENHMTNRGIMVSPATGNLVISMYYPVFENGKPLGYVGGAVYADEFMNSVTEMEIKGLSEAEYVFINAASKVYLYNENEELRNTETEDKTFLEIIDKVAGTSDPVADSIVYKDSDGKEAFVVYKYIPERNWIFIVKSNTKNLYSSIKHLRWIIGISCFITTSLIILAMWFLLHPVSKELGAVEKSLIRLSNIDLNASDEVIELIDKNDECGKIASAVSRLCSVLKESTGDINRILSEMANGNLAVDVNMHTEYYTGDFAFLADVLKEINTNLSNVIKEISVASEQVHTGAENVAASAQSLSQGTIEQTASIENLAENIKKIERKVNDNSNECKNAHTYMEQTFNQVNEASDKMQYLTNAMGNINSSFEKITGIIKTIEDIAFQTNILALNAAVEAARAGEAGKGFAVVADEVRNLAAKAAEAVQDTSVLIESSNTAVDEGMGITTQTSDAIKSLNEYTTSLKKIIDIIAASSNEQLDMVNTINDEINQISGVVQNTSATAEESAAASEELTGQAISLNSLISRFKTE